MKFEIRHFRTLMNNSENVYNTETRRGSVR